MKNKIIPINDDINFLSMMENTINADKKRKKRTIKIQCDMCGKLFQKKHRFGRLCSPCYRDSELYLYED